MPPVLRVWPHISVRDEDAKRLKKLRRKAMFKKNAFIAMTALVSLAFITMSTAKADDDDSPCYTMASLKGTFAVVVTYGDNVALALAIRTFDGNGNLTGTFTLNEPTPGSTTGARTIVTGTNVGTYTVNCDGTAVVTRVLTASSGVVTTQTDDLLITKATRRDGHLVATALEDMVRTPSAIVPGGVFVFRSYTRRPD
jgi:hypothetical protein